jgi:membrane-associated phospholipid phosphatase
LVIDPVVSDNIVYTIDRAVEHAVQAPALQADALLQALGKFGNFWGGPGLIYFAVVIIVVGVRIRRRALAESGLRGLEAVIFASAVSGLAKGLLGRERPFFSPGVPWHWNINHGWMDARYFSMPSGHTTASWAFASAICVVAAKFAPLSRWGVTTAALASACIAGFARLYTHQHWMSDVVVGTLLGASVGIAVATWHARNPGTFLDKVLPPATSVATSVATRAASIR